MTIKIKESSNSHLIPRATTQKPESCGSYYPLRELENSFQRNYEIDSERKPSWPILNFSLAG
jgi:hypothetical protein